MASYSMDCIVLVILLKMNFKTILTTFISTSIIFNPFTVRRKRFLGRYVYEVKYSLPVIIQR